MPMGYSKRSGIKPPSETHNRTIKSEWNNIMNIEELEIKEREAWDAFGISDAISKELALKWSKLNKELERLKLKAEVKADMEKEAK